MEIRVATGADAEGIARVHERGWRVGYAHVFPEEKLTNRFVDPERWRERLEENAQVKLREKRLDLIAANLVGGGEGFGSPYNRLLVYGPGGLALDTGLVTKEAAAKRLMDCVSPLL